MLQELKLQHFDKSSQLVIIDKDLTILDTDNRLFKLQKGQPLFELHPFFYTLLDALQSDDPSNFFPCVIVENQKSKYYLDITFQKLEEEAYVILNDATKYYKELHEIYQIRNESILKYRISEENNKVLQEQRDFKNKFISNISHEIRTPINGIIGFLDILKNGALNREQLDLVNIIQQSSHNLMVVIDDLMDISRLEAGKLNIDNKRFDFKSLLDSLIDIYHLKASQKGLEFDVEASKKLPSYLIGDEIRLNQILTNLLENALNFTPEGSIKFSIKTKNIGASKVHLDFEIADTGIGIAEKELNKIFNHFTKRDAGLSQEGSGLGLGIAKELAELMGGTLDVESTINEGSTFKLELDLNVSHITKPAKRKTKSRKKLDENKQYRLLLAEDLEINQLLILKILKTYTDFKLDVAKNGDIALRLLQKQDYDLVMLDLTMPITDGIDLTHIIRKSENEKLRNIPIIALTAHASKKDKELAFDAGVDDYITKPIDTQNLIDTINKLLVEAETKEA